MRIIKLSLTLLFLFGLVSACDGLSEEENPIVVMHTEMGDMTFILFDETEKHRENFVKLAKEGFYDKTSFHRIISGEMVQGGDPNTKDEDRFNDGMGGPGYKLPAEIFPEIIHRKGALVSARIIGKDREEKLAHGSQFFIVYGKKWDNNKLDSLATARTREQQDYYIAKFLGDSVNTEIRDRLIELSNNRNASRFKSVTDSIREEVISQYDLKPIKYSTEARTVYETYGGMPEWDGDFTIFGQLIDGFDTFEKIMNAKTGPNGKPEEDLVISVEVFNENEIALPENYKEYLPNEN
ncbi:peptidylprolyl isomerase [Mangrovivirga sp. M17]|uniref:peptidylprolyl isomerase n=1 Tax=Mangrovivirga halotolerans TaxID=2993936 RepID=A0ABT3RXD8_9BACT|nr:peptidylprolyl isomerase [Mangrovivirga halotolerans]MCX2746023.1 peptidylprolyl isomerase [Mangrovivirga halotolerans]